MKVITEKEKKRVQKLLKKVEKKGPFRFVEVKKTPFK